MENTIRVSAAQFHVNENVDRNLKTCLRIIRKAGQHDPQLLVLPEFSNHCSWYDDAEHCYDVAVSMDGSFMQAIAAAVREISAHVVINCTVKRENRRVTGTSILMSPEGVILGTTNKQVLIGHENDFLEPATEAGPIVNTALGRIGMYSCMDGVMNETPRCLALRGAQLLCNSLNSFALDEGSLHIPVRAAENKVWVIAANKIGPLIPQQLVGPVSEATNIPPHFLDGAGDSQIVAPDGTVVALAGKEEEIIYADIEPALANDKSRASGIDVFATRRPRVYASLAEDPQYQELEIDGPDDVLAAAVTSELPVVESIRAATDLGVKLICFSENEFESANEDSVVSEIQAALPADVLVAAKIHDAQGEAIVLVSKDGVILRQRRIHVAGGADKVQFVDTEFGRIAVMFGADAIYPEVSRLAAMQSVSTVLVPAHLEEEWEGRTGIVERAAENRMNFVLASKAAGIRGSVIATLQKDFTIMTEWQERTFDGLLSCPEIHRSTDDNGLLVAEIHPAAASNKECSRNTHLIASRPWTMLEPMVSPIGHSY